MRRLRFRRPRPKLIDVENPDGDLVGSPIELKEQGEDELDEDYLDEDDLDENDLVGSPIELKEQGEDEHYP